MTGGDPSVTTRQRLPRRQRIRKRAEFVRIQDGPAARVTTRHLLILLANGLDARPEARLGVVASRKVGPAVTRNRAKRLVREVFRRSRGVFPAGLDVVVIVRPSPRWGPRAPKMPPGPPLLRLAELAAEVAGAAPALARRARELGGR